MEAAAVKNDKPATIAPVKLSDGSISYSVLIRVPGERSRMVLAATDAHHAARLRDEINACAWVELA
jgi:hypothetical protein